MTLARGRVKARREPSTHRRAGTRAGLDLCRPASSLARQRPLTNHYDHREIEPRWQKSWHAQALFAARDPGTSGFDPGQPKFYVLDMFPYPSGSGLHVGHAVGYIGSDVVARRARMQGYNVLHPMGWDAFGLPAEQYAIQTGRHPRDTTQENTANFKRQLERIGLSFDWSREIDTSKPEYYRWTQWIFARMFERGLAYQAEVPVWWCEELKTVLANEEVINGRSERGNHPCVRRPQKQWMLKITAYAERLLADLDLLDWPEAIKQQQREWIGRSEGAQIDFPLEQKGSKLSVFTTRPDTLFGATFLVLAPEHPLVESLTQPAAREAVGRYVAEVAKKSELERTDLAKTKSGVFTGAYALHPGREAGDPRRKIPIWIADYVLPQYGTGAIMAVPGQDQRDWDFAAAHGLDIVRTVEPPPGFDGQAYDGEGLAINSRWLDGLDVAAAKRKAIEWLLEQQAGSARVTYKLRDWLFSRQRYWGEPFPLLHLEDGSVVRVEDSELPIELPAMTDFSPAADGSAPLARAKTWVETTHAKSGQRARRDTDTMPGWAGSCWYWLRFMDPHNAKAPFAPEAQSYWGPVDLYVGGAAHAVMHLLYARFWHKVLFDLGLVATKEPFQRLFNQGLITAHAYQDEDGRLVPAAEVLSRGNGFVRRADGRAVQQIVTKMAKSLGNVVNPDAIIAEHGADTLRVYEMFMGPLADSKPWNTRDIAGSRRFVERVWRMFVDEASSERVRPQLAAAKESARPEGPALELEKALHRAQQRVDDSYKSLNFNTAVAALMTFVNEVQKREAALRRSQAERFLLLLAPIAPHICEELWARLGNAGSICLAPWPKVDPRYLVDDEVELAVQVAGRVRARVRLSREAPPEEIEAAAREAARAWLEGKDVARTVVVPGKLINLIPR